MKDDKAHLRIRQKVNQVSCDGGFRAKRETGFVKQASLEANILVFSFHYHTRWFACFSRLLLAQKRHQDESRETNTTATLSSKKNGRIVPYANGATSSATAIRPMTTTNVSQNKSNQSCQ